MNLDKEKKKGDLSELFKKLQTYCAALMLCGGEESGKKGMAVVLGFHIINGISSNSHGDFLDI